VLADVIRVYTFDRECGLLLFGSCSKGCYEKWQGRLRLRYPLPASFLAPASISPETPATIEKGSTEWWHLLIDDIPIRSYRVDINA
jgi:hypothetical protein